MPAKKNKNASPALTNPIFTDADAARAHLESLRWPDGAFCPHCGEAENVTRMDGEAHRKGLHNCKSCRKQFSVTVGTLFERSHIPLNKWMLAFHLMAASKKGMSAHQMHRQLDITYKTAWFMCHRIREAMRSGGLGPLGGEGSLRPTKPITALSRNPRSAPRRPAAVHSPRAAGPAPPTNALSFLWLSATATSVRSMCRLPIKRTSPGSCARTLPRSRACTQTIANSIPARSAFRGARNGQTQRRRIRAL